MMGERSTLCISYLTGEYMPAIKPLFTFYPEKDQIKRDFQSSYNGFHGTFIYGLVSRSTTRSSC